MGGVVAVLTGGKGDSILAQKMRKKKELEEAENEKDQEERRRNSLVNDIEDWLNGKVDPFEPKVEEKVTKKKKKDDSDSDSSDSDSDGSDGEEEQEMDPRTAAMEALIGNICQGNFKILREEVINHIATINQRFDKERWEGNAILHVLCSEGYDRMTDFATDPKSHSIFEITDVDVNQLNEKDRSPLHLVFTPPQRTFLAKKFGLGRDMKVVTQKPEELEVINDWDKPGYKKERERIVETLLLRGAEPDLNDFFNYTPLMYACMLGWKKAVLALLEKQVDIEKINSIGQTAFLLACKYKHLEIVEHFLENYKFNLNLRDMSGDTALHYAVREEHVEIAELLLDFGASIDIENYKKESPLMIACVANRDDLVHLLLDFNCERDKKALDLLFGPPAESVYERVNAEEEERRRKEEERRKLKEAAAQRAANKKNVWGDLDTTHAWVPYKDKRGRGIFYYNKITRHSQWEKPSDYVYDKMYEMKEATFGMSFYH